jgi:hypothetical protein
LTTNEILDCPHIIPAGNGLHIGQSPFFKSHNLVAVNVIHIVYAPLIEVFEESLECRIVIVVRFVCDVRLLLFQVSFLRVLRWRGLQFHI